ncbi:YihY/virulence factor BrkB family protein [Ramlibacter algicola]|uniref:YihY/virulence factor BrkB family protein n=1 Tax=Ramlibacter algicola TaxID=2795217 RepID=A0A934Q1F5_9BURK|nr:YihY/virulence factor BrkB family protein [Ramlibacter algicola]MBK0393003.1 YihY/virulence factor BrkB family protein [Ramlibacter algicola]
MRVLSPAAMHVLAHPGAFLLQVLRGFLRNQGLLLAGAVAYYALLSVVPLLVLAVVALSHFVDPAELFETLGRYLGWLLPGQSQPVLVELRSFVEHRDVVGWVLLLTMLFFSSLAFSVLEKAMAVIFTHRFHVRHRHFLVSVLMPYCYVLCLAMGLLLVTFVAGRLEALGSTQLDLLGHSWSLEGLSGALLYLLGFVGEVVLLTSLYIVMPVGRLTWRHALPGGITAAILWEVTRHVLVWYFGTLSQVNVVYGSLTTAVVVLLSLEIGATLVLFGAQVISEYERLAVQPAAS